MNVPRIGQGYDVHRLAEGRPLVLGGVTIPWLLHALMDALLGAAALGDIGGMFPDTDERYRGADSRVLLRKVRERLTESGYAIGNVDMTLVAQKPRIAPYIPRMRQNIAQDLELPLDAVSVKATTEEHLGFTGDGSGMSAQAALLFRL